MGEMADYYMEQDMFAALEHEQYYADLVNRGIWRTKDGREIEITKMTDSHLLNTIKLLKRSGDHHGYRPSMILEARLRGIL